MYIKPNEFDLARETGVVRLRPQTPPPAANRALVRVIGLLYLAVAGVLALPSLAIVGIVFLPTAMRQAFGHVLRAADRAGDAVLGR